LGQSPHFASRRQSTIQHASNGREVSALTLD
jgi:hypothetical protein